METEIITIGGMTCMGCVGSVKRVLDGFAGVSEADVTLQPAQAKVTYDPAKTDLQGIKTAISDAGYDVA